MATFIFYNTPYTIPQSFKGGLLRRILDFTLPCNNLYTTPQNSLSSPQSSSPAFSFWNNHAYFSSSYFQNGMTSIILTPIFILSY